MVMALPEGSALRLSCLRDKAILNGKGRGSTSTFALTLVADKYRD